MKTTKTETTEITVCDLCGQESNPRECQLCKKEICDRCSDLIHVDISRHSPGSCGSLRATHVRVIATKLNGRYCIPCSLKMLKALREYGLVESLDENWMSAVLDYPTLRNPV
jgi:hypothetical protein